MFNLNLAVAEWRQGLVDAGIGTQEILDELESHLWDELEQRLRAGAGEQDAFNAAVALLGDSVRLKSEFGKLQPATPTPSIFLRIFYLGSTLFMLGVNTWTLLAYDVSIGERVLGIATFSLLSLYLFALPYLLRTLRPGAYLRLARGIKAGANLVWLWTICAILSVEHVVSVSISIAMFFWCLSAAIGLSLFAFLFSPRRFPGGNGGISPFSSAIPQPIPPAPSFPPEFDAKPLPESFGPSAYESLAAARAEAVRLGHEYIGTEHVLLGLLAGDQERFSTFLQRLKLEPERVRLEIQNWVSPLPASPGKSNLPFTPRASRALGIAAKEANRQKRPFVGPEDILLGLAIEGGGVAARVLRKLGIRVSHIRARIPTCSRA